MYLPQTFLYFHNYLNLYLKKYIYIFIIFLIKSEAFQFFNFSSQIVYIFLT